MTQARAALPSSFFLLQFSFTKSSPTPAPWVSSDVIVLGLWTAGLRTRSFRTQGCSDREDLGSPRAPAGRGQSKKADLGQVLGHPGSYGPNSYVAATAAKSLQSCPTLCDPIDGSPPGSPMPGILQARTLEWVAISFSNA